MFTINDRPVRNILVQSDHGAMIVNRNDFGPNNISVGAFVLDHGNNNTVEANIACQVLGNVDRPVILDIGSNIGTFATWVAKWASHKQGKVYCFEPQREVFQMLCGNMAINNIFNVYAYQLALGNEEKYIEINDVDYDKSGSFASFTLTENNTGYQTLSSKQLIKLTTVDKFVEEYKLEKVDYIKIDAEGLDIQVIEGAMNTINKYKPDLFVEYLNLGSSGKEDTLEEGRERLTKYLNDLGYRTMVIQHDIFASVRDVFVQ